MKMTPILFLVLITRLTIVTSLHFSPKSLFELNEGDVAARKARQFSAAVTSINLWPGGVIYYELDPNFPYLQRVELAFRTIEDKTCIDFRPRTTQKDYIKITFGNGCWSFVGRVGGRQGDIVSKESYVVNYYFTELSLGNNCHNFHTIIHELLHAVGLPHEHTRPDRDRFINVHFENIIKGREGNFNKRTTPDSREQFDFESVMLYGPFAFSANKKPTLSSKVKDQTVKESREKPFLSNGDVESIKLLYKCV